MKTYWEMNVILHAFLAFALDREKISHLHAPVAVSPVKSLQYFWDEDNYVITNLIIFMKY
jgi:hypothetical protein